MKKGITTMLAVIILLGMVTTQLRAQSIVAGISNNEFTGTTDELFTSKEYIKISDVNVKAVKNFEKSFKATSNVNWYKGENGFIVFFYQEKMKKICYYSTKGNWLYMLFSYNEDKLVRPVWHRVKQVYYEYSIIWVNEIQTMRKTIYVVHLEGKENFKNIRVDDENMSEIQEIRKK